MHFPLLHVLYLALILNELKLHGMYCRNVTVCDFSEHRYGIQWVCVRPLEELCPREMNWYEKEFAKNKTSFAAGSLFKIGVSYQAEIKGSGSEIQSEKGNNKHEKYLKSCQRDKRTNVETNKVSGYFENGLWHSTVCNNSIKTLEQGKTCLRNKIIHLIGDSTVRQLDVELASFLKIRHQTFGPSMCWSMPRMAKDEQNNFSMKYRAHGHPLHNTGDRESRPPIVETLIKISPNNSRETVVVFNVGAHFVLYDPDIFLYRLKAIRRALDSLKKRLPNVKIFVKGNVANREVSDLVPGEWVLYRLNQIFRQYFNDNPYIDTWSMSSVHPH